jgi:serine/threonine protein kinase
MECGDDDDPDRILDDIDELFELINEVCVTNEEGAILSLKDFKGNTNKCQTLANRILTLKGPLQRLQSNPKMGCGRTRNSLRNLMTVLSRAVSLINEFGNENWLQKVINEGTAKEAFDQVNNELISCIQDLQLELDIENFNDRQRDREDDLADRAQIQELLKGLHDKQDRVIELLGDVNVGAALNSIRERLDNMQLSAPAPQNGSALTEINYSEVDCQEKIGAGGFGDVYKGIFRGTEVAIKKVLADKLSKDAVEELTKEAEIMSGLRHPNVVLFMGFCRPPDCCLLFEYIRRGSLYDLLYRERRKFSMHEVCRIHIDIACGMAYLHGAGVVHRDIKPANILVDEHFRAKIADFGLSKVKQESMTLRSRVGTPQYMAPELLSPDHLPHNEKVDVYSFAILMVEVLNNEQPFSGKDPIQVAMAVLMQGLRPEIPKSAPEGVSTLITDCWAANATSRPAFDEILARLRRLVDSLGEDPGNSAMDEKDSASDLNAIGVSFLKNGDFERAAHYYQRAIKKDPEHANSLGNFANLLHYIRKDYDQAIVMYKRAIRADSHHANNLGNYANLLHYVKKDAERAAKYYKCAIKADPHHANNLGNYAALLHYMVKDYAAAREHYERALEVDANHAINLANYAEFLAYACGEIERAEEFYVRGLRVNPNDHVLMRKYGVYLRDLKKNEAHANEVLANHDYYHLVLMFSWMLQVINKADVLARKAGAIQ